MERWIIGECNSEGDGVSLYQFAGTAEQVKNEIVRMVISGKDEEDYEYGSEEIRQISTQPDGSLYGYANYTILIILQRNFQISRKYAQTIPYRNIMTANEKK